MQQLRPRKEAAGATATKKKQLLWKEGDLVSAVVADVAYAPPITKPAAVEVELNRWLSRPPDADVETTMLEFWKKEPECMLRRVAMRAGALMLSQCATERVNKLPKEIWNPKRMSLTSQSVIRDVFLVANKERLPPLEFAWDK